MVPLMPSMVVQGRPCNMAKAGDVASFANFARDAYGTVDLW